MSQAATHVGGQSWAPPKNDVRPIVWTVGQLWDTGNLLWRVVSVDNGVAAIQQVDRKHHGTVSRRTYQQERIPLHWTFVGLHRRDSMPD